MIKKIGFPYPLHGLEQALKGIDLDALMLTSSLSGGSGGCYVGTHIGWRPLPTTCEASRYRFQMRWLVCLKWRIPESLSGEL